MKLQAEDENMVVEAAKAMDSIVERNTILADEVAEAARALGIALDVQRMCGSKNPKDIAKYRDYYNHKIMKLFKLPPV